MNRRRCEFCERDIPLASAVCPHCSKPRTLSTAWSRQALLAALAVALAVGVFAVWGLAMR